MLIDSTLTGLQHQMISPDCFHGVVRHKNEAIITRLMSIFVLPKKPEINGNRDVEFLKCDYLLVQWCVKLTLVVTLLALVYLIPSWLVWAEIE